MCVCLQEVLHHKDEGFHCLQQVIDSAHLVLPNTSPAGKDIIRDDLHGLKQDWDDMIAVMNDAKTHLEGAVLQWDHHDDSVMSLGKWLTELEESLQREGTLQATLAEKRAQLERVKVSDAFWDVYLYMFLRS